MSTATTVSPRLTGTPTDGTRTSRFRGDIQGLRAVAVLLVVLYHAGLGPFSGGYVGVDVFFVISGFLITQLLWNEVSRTGRLSLAGFWARRVRRLLPAATVVLVGTLLVAEQVLPPLRLRSVATDAVSAALYSANYRFAVVGTDYLGGSSTPSPLQHFWSLGVEEQFYLVFPVLLALALLARRGRPSRGALAGGIACVGLASLLLSVHLTRTDQPWAFYGLPTRAWELATGSLLALALPHVRRLPAAVATVVGWCGLAAIGWAALAFDARTVFPGSAVAVPVLGTAAVLAAGAVDTSAGAARLLERRLLQGIGAISYSWYLWHWPVLVLLGDRVHGWFGRLVLVVLSALLAAGTYDLVENRVRHLPALVASPRRTLVFGALLTLVSVLAAVLVPLTAGSTTGAAPAAGPPTLSGRTAPSSGLSPVEESVRAAVAAGVGVQAVPRNLTPPLGRAAGDKAAPFVDGCDLSFTASVSPTCEYGDPAAGTRVVAFGDSHAAQWFPDLDALAQQRHWRLTDLTKATCPPMDIRIVSPVLGREFTECEQWRASALKRIAADRPALVVVDVTRHYGPEYGFRVGDSAWVDALGTLVRQLRQQGSRVLVLGATPKPPGDVPECLSAHLRDVPACTSSAGTEVNAGVAMREHTAVASAGGTFVDVAPWLCTPQRCAVVLGNLLVFRDDNHLTTGVVRWLAPVFSAAVDRAMTGRPPA